MERTNEEVSCDNGMWTQAAFLLFNDQQKNASKLEEIDSKIVDVVVKGKNSYQMREEFQIIYFARG